jgi:peptidoglycan/LPS O-acetylase OafA/YrhL
VKDKVYFPNLNGIRFIAVSIVIISHVFQLSKILRIETTNRGLADFFSGKLGVVLFFVLSGFLITFLLLKEEALTGKIAIGDFYRRRILRIWPLYFIIVGLSFFVLSQLHFFSFPGLSSQVHESFLAKLGLFCIFLPNLALVVYPSVPYASQLWSVGVEEQFYLFWPVLIKKIKKRELLLCSIVVFFILVNFLIFPMLDRLFPGELYIGQLRNFWKSFNIDCMAIGGIFAVLLFKKNRILDYLYSYAVQVFVIAALFVLIGFKVYVPYMHYEVYSILFGILILNMAANPRSLFNLENRFCNYTGKISYGMYMYHAIAIVISLKVLSSIGIHFFVVQLAVSFILTVIISGLSYEYIESRFIKRKLRFSKIISGDNVD